MHLLRLGSFAVDPCTLFGRFCCHRLIQLYLAFNSLPGQECRPRSLRGTRMNGMIWLNSLRAWTLFTSGIPLRQSLFLRHQRSWRRRQTPMHCLKLTSRQAGNYKPAHLGTYQFSCFYFPIQFTSAFWQKSVQTPSRRTQSLWSSKHVQTLYFSREEDNPRRRWGSSSRHLALVTASQAKWCLLGVFGSGARVCHARAGPQIPHFCRRTLGLGDDHNCLTPCPTDVWKETPR